MAFSSPSVTKISKISTTVTVSAARQKDARTAGAQLAFVYPDNPPRRVHLNKSTAVRVFGRDPGAAEETVLDPTVSRRHFAISWDSRAGSHMVADLDSHNGSSIDGTPLTGEPVALYDGAVLQFGSVLAVYELIAPGGVDAPQLASLIPGGSPKICMLRQQIAAAAADPSPVLITGPTGAGKEHVVRALHELSGRPGPFVALNVSELSANLVESQLFGHAKGAFSGADSASPGLFRHANGGTLFLDEIGELPMELQPKLLRVTQEKEVRPVGSTQTHSVDVRLVAATNRNLEEEVVRGAFRRDLWARLSLLELQVPPLNERRGDILDWIRLMYNRWCAEREQPESELRFDCSAVSMLLLTDWAENLRGLDRVVHRVAPKSSFSDEPITAVELAKWAAVRSGSTVDGLPAVPPLERSASSVEKPSKKPAAPKSADELRDVLKECGGSIRAAARWYDRDRRQIYRWMDSLGVSRDEFE